MEKEPIKKLYDHRCKIMINIADIEYIKLALHLFEGIKFDIKYTENQIYAYGIEAPLKVPKGKAWIALSGIVEPGYDFLNIIKTAKQLKDDIKDFNKPTNF